MDNDLEKLLSPYEYDVTHTRNGTELSRFCEKLVRTFLEYRTMRAIVHWQMTEYSLETMYLGLRNICKKNEYRKHVSVHKQNDELILIRHQDGNHR